MESANNIKELKSLHSALSNTKKLGMSTSSSSANLIAEKPSVSVNVSDTLEAPAFSVVEPDIRSKIFDNKALNVVQEVLYFLAICLVNWFCIYYV